MKINTALLFLLVSAFVFAQESISFEKATFNHILSKAKKENKIIFLDAYAEWCGPCKLMEKNIFPKDEVKQFYNANFINARIDMEKGEGRDIQKKYGVYSYPTYLFLNGDGEVVYKGMGYLEAPDFLQLGSQAKIIGEGGGGKERFEKGETDPEFLLNTAKLNANIDPEFAKKVSERYFQVRKKKAFTQDELAMLFYFLRSENDPNYKVFVNEKPEILKLLPESSYNQFHTQIKLNTIAENAVDKDKKTINDAKFLDEASKLMSVEDAENYLKILKLNAYRSLENWSGYEKAALENYKNGDGFDAKELMTAAFVFAEKISNPTSLKQAVIWTEKALQQAETPDGNYILARLHLKSGNKEAAKKYATQAVKLAKEKGMDASVPEKLLLEIK
ncbi:thioredoxin family protein [Chryseobacterium taklimakanense]|uniref:thioredoxin family protein n=1 Tax=Chryseobacterium taklimakanense TaxID=536441 RepID=UPI001EF72D2C|nr:thioredoxin fold domain-containing protein [Chryseobacterium taklimakanense]MCG7281254.1 thioredoxin family protein [Chryseobacterium taklimakanense]